MNVKLISPSGLLVVYLISGLLALSSCNNPGNENRHSVPNDNPNTAEPSIEARTSNTLVIGDAKTLETWLEKSRGNVVLIDFWATWCGPCVQQFPHAVELAEQHKEEGLKIFAVSMDEPDEVKTVSDFLERKKAKFETLLTRYGIGAEFVNAFDIRGDIPFYRLYDRRGILRYSFSADPDGIQDCEVIDNLDLRVKELLSEAP